VLKPCPVLGILRGEYLKCILWKGKRDEVRGRGGGGGGGGGCCRGD
jgi:hypothetical protein